MSWDSKSNSAWITKDDVAGAIPSALNAIGSGPGKSGSEWINFTEFIAWVQTSGLSNSTKWITKSAVLPSVIFSSSDTIYVSSWYDGGNSPNNAVVDGWCSSADAAAQTAYVGGGPFTHTVYYNGTLGDGTKLYINGVDLPDVGYGAHVVDSGYGYNGGSGCSSPYYYLSTANATFQSSTNGTHYYDNTITITNFSLVSHPVYIYLYVDPSTSSSGIITICAQSSEPLVHGLGISFFWGGNLGGTISDTIAMPSGSSCNSNTYYSSSYSSGEDTTTFNFNGLFPSAWADQVYTFSTTYITWGHPC